MGAWLLQPLSFKLRPDKSESEIQIPYSQVLRVKKNPGALTWVLVGAVLAIIVVIVVAKQRRGAILWKTSCYGNPKRPSRWLPGSWVSRWDCRMGR